MRFLDRHNHERINNEIMFRVLNATPLNSYRLGTRRKRKIGSFDEMAIFSRDDVSFLDEKERKKNGEEALFLDAARG